MWELACHLTVGASLLAKNVNDNACLLNECGACEFFASKLAPTMALRQASSHRLIFIHWGSVVFE
ncbi:hypothetical protein PFLL34_00053 [Pseudomonas fluorescens]|uniref:Uncharacterized protein n=1 Tax=Pseudomonas azotoformans TaxID=47878 RepID=A0A4Q0HN88_PSEAZ|nr:hypothetical protein TX25_12030 [Pseudomonas lactis]KWV83332.1 hypothetical protein PFLL34_00053 [Pseudomonas fluorescens]RXE50521.1 hypothetical protein B4O85_24755 [Pseudomonas azotoformans]